MSIKTRISVIEDTDEIRDRLVQVINKTEDLICITNYPDAESALTEISDVHPDIVIMDIGLPQMSGIECMLRLKSACPNIAFLMFTVFDNDDHIFHALRAGASGYIMKDERPKGVIRAIQEYLKGGAPMSPDISKRVLESFHRYQPKQGNVESLTSHQVKILDYISQGLLNKEIAHLLNITEGSIKVQISRIYKKLQVNNRVEAINKYNS